MTFFDMLIELGESFFDLSALRPDPVIDQQFLVIRQMHQTGKILAQPHRINERARRMSALHGEVRKHRENCTGELDVRIHALTAEATERNERTQQALEARMARHQQAYHSAKTTLATRIQERKDRRIGKMQGEIMRNRQNRQTELDEEVARDRGFRRQIAADREVRRGLRLSVLSSFRTFCPWLDSWFTGRRGSFPVVKIPETEDAARSAMLERLELGRGIAAAAGKLP